MHPSMTRLPVQSSPGADSSAAVAERMARIIDHDHQRVGLWMEAHGAAHYRPGSTCIGLEWRGSLVAGTLYDYFNGSSIVANIAIAGPITRKWLWYIFAYPFRQLQASVILGFIASDNQKSRKLVRHFGFTELTDIPDADPSGALVLYTMHKDHCRFIKEPYGKA